MKSKQREKRKTNVKQKNPIKGSNHLRSTITPSEDPRSLYLKLLRYSLSRLPQSEQRNRGLGLLRARDFQSLYDWADSLAKESFEDAAMHFAARQVSALIRKYPWDSKSVPKLDPLRAALDTFGEAEERCRKTNARFSRRNNLLRSRFHPLIEEMRRYIHSVLGSEPNMEVIYERSGFGTGASIGVHGNATNLHRKVLRKSYTCTPQAFPYVVEAMWRNPHIRDHFLQRGETGLVCYDKDSFADNLKKKITWVDSNKISFVPKTAKTHRAIAVEPLLNGYIQKGIDSVLRSLLERNTGRYLNFQGHNQLLAREGSITGAYATVDLSSASDTVSTTMLYYMLPRAWFGLLLKARSNSFQKKDKHENYQKFSSMGNNFTFPLETLIFQAAVRSAMKSAGVWGTETYSVYGDDIVIPTAAVGVLIPLLKFLGFVPNPSKSFWTGPFRESCGADWHGGQDVRPVELDYHLADVASLMIFHNACFRSERCLNFFEDFLPTLREVVPEDVRFMRPFTGRYTGKLPVVNLMGLRNLNGAFTVPQDVFMASKHAIYNRHEQRWSWKEFQYSAEPDGAVHKSADFEGDFLSLNRISYAAFLSGQPRGEPTLRYLTKRKVRVI